MKRGGTLRRHKRLNAVSAKVKAGKPEYDAVYRRVDERSGGRCEVNLHHVERHRCTSNAVDHHHTRRPRRLNHSRFSVIHLCRRHHDDVSASFQNGRLFIEPNGDETFTCYYRFKPENPFK